MISPSNQGVVILMTVFSVTKFLIILLLLLCIISDTVLKYYQQGLIIHVQVFTIKATQLCVETLAD